ncbi:unnamed protein product [Brugia pahangi]|uniref:PUM-HD domain-containing protein n=1 Tax=Brugia pahangi TaxID=6280 RepID=A0A158PR00_BRUPA|nr:unnamed protein product [Brugia pahangi]
MFVREVLPNYMIGMLSLPVHSTPYLLRVVSDVLEKHLDDNFLKEIFKSMLKEKPQLITALYASSKVGTRRVDKHISTKERRKFEIQEGQSS